MKRKSIANMLTALGDAYRKGAPNFGIIAERVLLDQEASWEHHMRVIEGICRNKNDLSATHTVLDYIEFVRNGEVPVSPNAQLKGANEAQRNLRPF